MQRGLRATRTLIATTLVAIPLLTAPLVAAAAPNRSARVTVLKPRPGVTITNGTLLVQVHISKSVAIGRIVVRIGGKRVGAMKRPPYALRVSLRHLRRGRHHLTIAAYARNGSLLAVRTMSFSAGSGKDDTPPSIPTGLRISSNGGTVTLSWRRSVGGAVGYKVFRNGSYLRSTTHTTLTDSKVKCGWLYGYKVAAYDAAGNRSALSQAASVTASCGGSPQPPGSTSGDRTPPSAPTSLHVTATTTSSISLAWKASTDNVGVTGYGVSDNGGSPAVVAGTTDAVAGLACGTPYRFSVTAHDAAGNVSAAAMLNASTASCASAPPPTPPAPPAPAPSVFVAVGGSDAAGCTQAAPCRSFDRAYHVAGSGAAVAVAAGTYPAQTLSADASKTSAVIFEPAAGASVTTGVITFGQNVKHVEMRDMTITRQGASIAWEAWTAWSGGNSDITMRNISATNGTFKIEAGASNINVIGGSYGNITSSSTSDAAYSHLGGDSHDILIDGVSFHDFVRTSTAIHMECVHISSAYNVTIRDSRFSDCAIYAIFMDVWSGHGTHDVLIENNFFDQARNVNGACCAYDAIWINTAMSTSNITIRYNSFADSTSCTLDGTGCSVSLYTTGSLTNVNVIANYGPARPYDCQTRVNYSHNVWKGATCSPTDTNTPTLGYLNTTTLNLHLLPGASAIGHGDPTNYPPTDIDGNPRPGNGGPDAGADEVS